MDLLVQGIETKSSTSLLRYQTLGLARAFRKTCAIQFSKNEDNLALSIRKRRTGNLASVICGVKLTFSRGLYSLQRAQYRCAPLGLSSRPRAFATHCKTSS